MDRVFEGGYMRHSDLHDVVNGGLAESQKYLSPAFSSSFSSSSSSSSYSDSSVGSFESETDYRQERQRPYAAQYAPAQDANTIGALTTKKYAEESAASSNWWKGTAFKVAAYIVAIFQFYMLGAIIDAVGLGVAFATACIFTVILIELQASVDKVIETMFNGFFILPKYLLDLSEPYLKAAEQFQSKSSELS